MTAARTDEPIRPSTSRQVLLAGILGGEVGLKLAKRPGGTAVAAPLYTTYWGLLKQPDNQKLTKSGTRFWRGDSDSTVARTS